MDVSGQAAGPRIEPEENPDSEQQHLLSKTLLTPSSDPLNLFRVLVRHPELMKRVNALGGLFMAHGSLPAREREKVILRVALRTGCDYEYAQHVSIARRVGLSQDEIDDLARPLDQGKWRDEDVRLLQLADEIMDSGEASSGTWGAVHTSHDDNQMMELVMLVGYYQMLAAFLKTVGVPPEEGQPGLQEET